MNKPSLIFLLLVICLINSCNRNETKQVMKAAPELPPSLLEVKFEGIYQAILAPINKQFSGHLNGSLTLVRENDDFMAYVRFSGGPKSIIHIQNIHTGTRCPTLEDDINNDSIIDSEEGNFVYKEVIIPLDDDLSSQWLGLGTFPASNQFGQYQWSRSTSYKKMLQDIFEEDINLQDDIIKLPSNKLFSLEGNVIVITGISDLHVLPESVLTRGRLTKHQALPIACGVIRKLTHVPGVIDNDETGISYSDGETIGGSSGADDGAIFYPNDPGDDFGEEPNTSDNSTEYAPEGWH